LILRKDDGELVGARTKVVYGVEEAVEAEAMGLEAAIEMRDRIQDREVIIEMDNQSVVQAVLSGRYPRRYWGLIARRCGDYIRENPKLTSVQWVRRTGNNAAHQMARWAAIEPNRIWVDNYPPIL
jgi:ribonuclease HI